MSKVLETKTVKQIQRNHNQESDVFNVCESHEALRAKLEIAVKALEQYASLDSEGSNLRLVGRPAKEALAKIQVGSEVKK